MELEVVVWEFLDVKIVIFVDMDAPYGARD